MTWKRPMTDKTPADEHEAAIKMKRDLIEIINQDTLIDCVTEDLIALAKGLVKKGWTR